LHIVWFLLGHGISCTRQEHRQTPILEDMTKETLLMTFIN